ncbi:glycosyltransferase [Alkalihalobacillus sp. FSL R5-0424]
MVKIKTQPLILHASIGYGHTKTANVLANEIDRLTHYKSEVMDLFDSLPVWQQRMIRKGYFNMISTTPVLWDICYRYTSKSKKGDRLFESLARNLFHSVGHKILESRRPFILSTHVLITRLLATWIKWSTKNIPLYHISTDFKLHRLAIHPQVSGYFLSGLEPVFSHMDVPSSFHSYGIPIECSTGRPANKEMEKERLGLPKGKLVIMIAGGGEGIARYEEIIHAFKHMSQVHILCFTGMNQRVPLKLKHVENSQNVKVIPFTNEFSTYVGASDVLITKAGGLTLAHAITETTPIVIYQPLPGQEWENALLLHEKNAAILALNKAQLHKAVHTVLFNQKERSAYLKQANVLGKPNATNHIIQQVILETHGHEPLCAHVDAESIAEYL